MQAIAQRNERAFAELYDRYSPRMYRFFMRMFWQDAEKSADFTQELFLKIIEKPHLFQPGRSFRTWIYTIAGNLCKNEFRRLKIREEELPAWPDIAEEDLPERIDRQVFEQQLRESIARLSPLHRECFVLRYQEELSVAEIAEITDCPEGTVKSRLHYALRQVCAEMSAWKTV